MKIFSKPRILLMLVLVAGAIFHGRSVARRNLVNRTAAELSADAANLSRLIESGRFRTSAELSRAFEQIRRRSRLSIVSIQLHDRDGNIAAQIGLAAAPLFPAGFAGTRPVFRVQQDAAGVFVVEALPIRWPAVASRFPLIYVAEREAPAIIEISARL